MKKKISLFFLMVCILLSGCSATIDSGKKIDIQSTQNSSYSVQSITLEGSEFDFDLVPQFKNEPYVIINNNIPDFYESDITTYSFETYGELDYLGRCTECMACIGKDLMPTEKRGAIGSVKPTGWQTVKYNNVDGNYLYNRCHLIGYQLTAENANERNLITGTRYLNVDGMLPFEDEVATYIKATSNHVLYRVTPLFKGDELVARGVKMEGYSVEDNGKGVCFNVYCYNNQPGINIDYSTGKSTAESKSDSFNPSGIRSTYIINTSSKKFHRESCPSVDKISDENRKKYTGPRDGLIDDGYKPCGSCKP